MSSTSPVVPLVASSPQPLEATLVDEKLVPTINDDQQGQEDYCGWGHCKRRVIKDMGEHMSANSETCTSLMSTMKKESSFLLYTLRMLPYTTSMLDIVNILHVIILDKQ